MPYQVYRNGDGTMTYARYSTTGHIECVGHLVWAVEREAEVARYVAQLNATDHTTYKEAWWRQRAIVWNSKTPEKL